jgi:capsular polysaccharide biosynthesis protein
MDEKIIPLQKENEEIEIDLLDLFLEILDHWKMVLLSTMLVAVIAFCISEFIITPQYESTSELYVLSKSTSITSLSDLQLGTNLTNDYVVVIQGRPVLEQVIVNLGLEETYTGLLGKVAINNPSDSRILEITVTDPDPNRAKEIADEIAEVASEYIAEKMDQDPPTIIQYGYADGSPTSPSIGKNTVIGALLGLLAAVAVIVISYLLNDTISDTDDIEHKLGLTVLGTLPYEESMDEDAKKTKTAPMKKTPGKSA